MTGGERERGREIGERERERQTERERGRDRGERGGGRERETNRERGGERPEAGQRGNVAAMKMSRTGKRGHCFCSQFNHLRLIR